jgi:hypothetical protein
VFLAAKKIPVPASHVKVGDKLVAQDEKLTVSLTVKVTKIKKVTRDVLSPESRHNDDRPRDNNDDITSTDTSKEDDVSMRKSYLEAVLQ